jgi:hypothetical protein
MPPQGQMPTVPAQDPALEIRLVQLSQAQLPAPAQAQPLSASKPVPHELETKASRFALFA